MYSVNFSVPTAVDKFSFHNIQGYFDPFKLVLVLVDLVLVFVDLVFIIDVFDYLTAACIII